VQVVALVEHFLRSCAARRHALGSEVAHVLVSESDRADEIESAAE
jgi:hypothetical protein